MELLEALSALDHDNDEHWTAMGLPRVEIVAEMIGNEELKRADIQAITPDLVRTIESKEVKSESTLEEKLAAQLSEKQAELGEMSKKHNDLDKKRSALAREIGYIGGQLDKERSNKPQNDIAYYLASQNKLREKKAARMKELEGSGIKEILKSVQKAPLDAAMNQRKNVKPRPSFSKPVHI